MSLFLRNSLIFTIVVASAVAWAEVKSKISLSQDSFISPDFDSAEKSNFQYLGAAISAKDQVNTERTGLAYGVKASAQNSFTESSLSYFNMRELYLGYQFSFSSVAIGRKLITWSTIDQIWGFGFFEPHFRWNPFLPESQGLTGAFLNIGNEKSGVHFFVTGLYIPDQGASYEIKEGQFKKVSPWFPRLPNKINISGQTDSINYIIDTPKVDEVVLNPGYAMQLYYGDKFSGGFVQAAHAFKPPNQLHLGFQTEGTPQKQVDITVKPKVGRHQVSSLDLGYGQKLWSIGIGYLQEVQDEVGFEEKWTYQNFSPIKVASAFVEFRPMAESHIRIAMVKAEGGDGIAKGEHAQAAQVFLPNRLAFKEAASVDSEIKFRFSRQRFLKPRVVYWQGVANDFSILGLGTTASLDQAWSIGIGAQLVRADTNSEAQKSTAYQFENNDSVNVGVNYVF